MLNVFECFSGYGSHRVELEELRIKHKSIGISEVEPDAIIAYAHLHGCLIDEEKSNKYSDEQKREWLKSKGIGWDFKKEKSKIDRMPKKKMNLLFRAAWGSRCYGDISKIDWKSVNISIDLLTYSFPCFIAGTMILTGGGLKK